MKGDERVWKYFQKHLGYNEEEIELFKNDPRNADIISKGSALMKKTIVAEVVESHGCNSQHKVGDKFFFDGAGNLITSLSGEKVCIFALSNLGTLIFSSHELFYAGIDPSEMRFKRTGCFDVGVKCGGWGNIVMEVTVQEGAEKS